MSRWLQHTWRIFMLPIEFFLLSVHPVVDMDIVLDPRPNRTTYKGANSVIHLNSVSGRRNSTGLMPRGHQATFP